MSALTPSHDDRAVTRRRGLEATMADGTVLVADAWHPADPASGPWPVLVQRLPYGRTVASSVVLPHPVHLARRGYLVVSQDVRGRGDSGGTFEPFVHEADDGAATVQWAADLPGSDGRVGLYGFSYQGFGALAAAARRPPALRAVAVAMTAAGPGEGWTFVGGCRQWTFIPAWADQLAGLERGRQPPGVTLEALPANTALGPDPPSWFRDWLEHPPDDPWWAARAVDLEAIDVPAFLIGGWHDTFRTALPGLLDRLRPEAVLGPWPHMPWPDPGPTAERLVGFFDRALRGGPGPTPPAVTWRTTGGSWRSAPSWPPPTVERQRWTATSHGDAASRHGDGRLIGPAEAGDGHAPNPGPADVLVAQPLVPLPGTLDPDSDETATEDRRDVLCYTTDPQRRPLVIAGSAAATVTSRADVATHDLVVSLVDVAPDGRATRICTGAHRLAPGPTDLARTTTVDLGPTAWRVEPGHRLRLDLSASRFPAFDRNSQHPTIPAAKAGRHDCRVALIEVDQLVLDLPVDEEDVTAG